MRPSASERAAPTNASSALAARPAAARSATAAVASTSRSKTTKTRRVRSRPASGCGSRRDGCAAAARRTRARRPRGRRSRRRARSACARTRAERLDQLREIARRAAGRPWTAARPRRRRGRRGSGSRPTSARTASSSPVGIVSTELRLHAARNGDWIGSVTATRLQTSKRPRVRASERLPEVAELAHARGHVAEGEVLDARRPLSTSFQVTGVDTVAPRLGRGPSRPTPACAPRRSGCSRPARGPAGAWRSGTRGDQLRVVACQRLRELLGEGPHLLLRRPAHDGDVDVDARASRWSWRSSASRAPPARRAPAAPPRAPARTSRSGDRDRGRSAGSRAGRRRRSGRTTGSGRCSPRFTTQSSDARSLTMGKSMTFPDACSMEQVWIHAGARLRRALHEEERAVRAVGIALHHHRPVAQVRQQRRRDVGVVAAAGRPW